MLNIFVFKKCIKNDHMIKKLYTLSLFRIQTYNYRFQICKVCIFYPLFPDHVVQFHEKMMNEDKTQADDDESFGQVFDSTIDFVRNVELTENDQNTCDMNTAFQILTATTDIAAAPSHSELKFLHQFLW